MGEGERWSSAPASSSKQQHEHEQGGWAKDGRNGGRMDLWRNERMKTYVTNAFYKIFFFFF